MKTKQKKYTEMVDRIDEILQVIQAAEEAHESELVQVHPDFQLSARNLIHYRAMRTLDIRSLQKGLGNLGLSRLAKTESHVMDSLLRSRSVLTALAAGAPIKGKRAIFSIKAGNKLLNRHSKSLLGYRSKGRRTRIMVTLPSEAANDYQLVHDMIEAGMNTARVNCAHDDEEAWTRMIEHVRQANTKLNRNCKVAMDLAGPKIRTGPIASGPQVIKMSPTRDSLGRVIKPVSIWLGGKDGGEFPYIPLEQSVIATCKVGDHIHLLDTRGKRRRIEVIQNTTTGCLGTCSKTLYLESELPFYFDKQQENLLGRVGKLPSIEQALILHAGDTLLLHREKREGESATHDTAGNLESVAHISCTSDEVFQYVKAGEPILFDDGKIAGEITAVSEDEIEIRILQTRQNGGKLKADKGINLPISKLGIRGLTEKDRRDLPFVVRYADLVNMSFVNSAEDVEDLLSALEEHQTERKIGVVFKIETQSGFNHLTSILLAAMRMSPVGVMVARGDLAVETGWENMARIQEEMLSLCRAAHVPDIWATQVLESLAKKGIPSRAEITDAGMAQRAECVMLNKGPEILRAIHLLDSILKDRQAYMDKNAPMSPIMKHASEP